MKKHAAGIAQIIKFGVIGVLNTAVDFLVLNGLIAVFGTDKNGVLFVCFKAISFLVALLNSYFFNKFYVFAGAGKKSTLHEGAAFFAVSAVGFVLNVAIATASFAMFSGPLALSTHVAATLGALAGTLVVLGWNFAGYKYFVFKK
jgi:putative flippase GtrA